MNSVWRRCFSSNFQPEILLSEENRKVCIERFRKMRVVQKRPPTANFLMGKDGGRMIKTAAVLVPICNIDGEVSLLYTLRAADLRTHRGQVSFPGGMRDVSDPTVEHTAVREAQEELGINAGSIQTWCAGHEVFTSQSTCVTPIVGQIETFQPDALRINHREVEAVFLVPIAELCNAKKHAYTQFRQGYSTPVFHGDFPRIWGFTAVLTSMFLRCFVPGEGYRHRVKLLQPVRPQQQ